MDIAPLTTERKEKEINIIKWSRNTKY